MPFLPIYEHFLKISEGSTEIIIFITNGLVGIQRGGGEAIQAKRMVHCNLFLFYFCVAGWYTVIFSYSISVLQGDTL